MLCASVLVLIKDFSYQKEAGIPKKIVKVEDISGLSKFPHAVNLS